jgi:hypothetical protein
MPEILWPVQPRTNRTFGIIDAVTFTIKNNQPKVTIRLQPFLFALFFCGVCKRKAAMGIKDRTTGIFNCPASDMADHLF